MKLSDFDFDLPEHLIAVRPAVPRSSAKMLVAQGPHTRDMAVTDLMSVLRAGDHLV
ncbi:MAG: S-adenosylmethionine:tRNA ribosyltransferase-isomerase, partial [Octadecabacter sp.]